MDEKNDPELQQNFKKEELVPAMGCTEPISIAYAAAVARETLGCPAERIALEVSGNIIKNVKSVTVPNTGGLRASRRSGSRDGGRRRPKTAGSDLLRDAGAAGGSGITSCTLPSR